MTHLRSSGRAGIRTATVPPGASEGSTPLEAVRIAVRGAGQARERSSLTPCGHRDTSRSTISISEARRMNPAPLPLPFNLRMLFAASAFDAAQ